MAPVLTANRALLTRSDAAGDVGNSLVPESCFIDPDVDISGIGVRLFAHQLYRAAQLTRLS